MSDAATARDGFKVAQPRHAPIARALVWEECRVGGVVAAVCAALGAGLIASMRPAVGGMAWTQNDPLLVPVALLIPVLIALALILHPANSGHLRGGFAQRILWLPVPVPLAVGIVLGLRAVFVLAASLGVVAAVHLLFESGPAYTLALPFVAFYLVVQTVEWARAVVSGLTTAIALVLLLLATVLLAFLPDVVANAFPALMALGDAGLIALVVFAFPMAFALSIATVNATRGGRTIGGSMAWAGSGGWHGLAGGRRSCRSPLSALVWQEVRRFGWTLPAGATGITLIATAVIWLGGWDFRKGETIPAMSAFAMYGAVLIAAAAHGLRARVAGFSYQPGKPAGFYTLLPHSSAQAALAKCFANAAILVPWVAVVALTQWALTSSALLRDIVPFALANGMTSPHELAWTLLGRVILLLLLAWFLMAIGTRGARGTLAALLVLWALEPVTGMIARTPWWTTDTRLFVWCVVPLGAVIAYGTAWRRGLITLRPIAAWGCLWMVTAWLLHGASSDGPLTPLMLAECIAYSALVPLPFAFFTLDHARLRHGAAVVLARGASRNTGFHMTARRWAFAAPVLALALWMGQPTDPAYKTYLQANGVPPSLSDHNALYPAVPDDDNAALRYLAVGDHRRELREAFRKQHLKAEELPDDGVWLEAYRLDFDGPPAEHFDSDAHAAGRAYWEQVTAHIAPELRQIASEGPQPSRYPIDMRHRHPSFGGHLATLRGLARELEFDAYTALGSGDTSRAIQSMEAVLALQDSLRDEPVLWAQYSRFDILRAALDMAIELLSDTRLDDSELSHIDHALDTALPPLHEQRVIEPALRREHAVALIELDREWADLFYWELGTRWERTTDYLFTRIAMNPAGNRMVSLKAYERARADAEAIAMGVESSKRIFARAPYDASLIFAAPLNFMDDGAYWIRYSWEWEIRMQIAMARTAIAIERYRRDHGRLPASLPELVPACIGEVPDDIHAEAQGTPVRYLRHDEAGYTLYSVGPSGEDHGGHPRGAIEGVRTDDIVFRVHGPAAGRSEP